jgi:hypothetical protein
MRRGEQMTQEMTSFVLRFVREVGDEQEARWRGLVQHVQSGAERSFATFADAVRFMQGRVVENTVQAAREGERMTEKNPFTDLAGEMTKMWGDLGPQMIDFWSQAAEQVMEQSMAVRSQVDQAVAAALKAWAPPSGIDQDDVVTGLEKLSERIEQLAARVEALEGELTAQKTAPKRRRSSKRTTSSETE